MKLEDDGDWYLVVTNSIFKKWWKVGLVSTQSYSKGDQLIATLPYYENDGLYTTINRQGISYHDWRLERGSDNEPQSERVL